MGMNITPISSADYVQSTVAKADGATPAAITEGGLTAYYTVEGNPPGRWLGRGLDGIEREHGSVITSSDAVNVWQHFRNPSTGAIMGRPRRDARSVKNDNQLADSTKQTKRDLSGFDLTFTVPKDVSILWALGDANLQRSIAEAHHAALDAAVTYMEGNIAQTRAGHGGAVAVPIKGLVAGGWDHWDNREGEPHLHTHLLLANRVQRASDGKWVTLDSRALFNNAVHVSELHQNLLMDELTRRLGIEWEERTRGTTRAVVPDIKGMPASLRAEFSSRDAQVRAREDAAVQTYIERYGHAPSRKVRAGLHSAAWRATRKAKSKTVMPLSDRCSQWRADAQAAGVNIDALIGTCTDRDYATPLTRATAHDAHEVIATLTALNITEHTRTDTEAGAADSLSSVAEQIEKDLTKTRSTWSRANIRAEVERMTRMVRAASPDVRERASQLITEAVIERCIAVTPERYVVNTDDPRLSLRGTSVFDDDTRSVFTSSTALERENRLVAALTTTGVWNPPDSPTVEKLIEEVNAAQKTTRGYSLAEDQEAAVRAIMTDTSRMSVLIGPAGTGKTTTMSALKNVWEHEHGTGSLLGVTTSAQAAHVLSEELEAPAHTIAKWLYESTVGNTDRRTEYDSLIDALENDLLSPATRRAYRRRVAELATTIDSWTLHAGQMLVVDEASMASTTHLAELTAQADAAGARILLVGDHRQIEAVEAGGALSLLADHGPVHELTSVWRFHHKWEADASLLLRDVSDQQDAQDVLALYEAHERLHGGADDELLEQAYLDTRRALDEGRSALIIASTNALVDELNQRFSHDLRLAGRIDAARTALLRGDRDAGVGERVLARSNDRTIVDTDGDFIRNGTLMTVTSIHNDGSITAVREDNNATIHLSASYLRDHTELGYATTAHRCQGATVDEARVVIPSQDPIASELLYVAMTRGRDLNAAYIGEAASSTSASPATGLRVADEETPTWRERFQQMAQTHAAETSATTALGNAREDANNLQRLTSEYAYLLTLENHQPQIDTLAANLHVLPDALEESLILPSLFAAYRAADAHNPTATHNALTTPVTGVDPTDIDASLKIIAHRLRALTPNDPRGHALPGGLPLLTDRADHDVHELGDQVHSRIHDRITQLSATAPGEAWARSCPPHLHTDIAIYRDLYRVRTTTPLGPEPPARDTQQHSHWHYLTAALATTSEALSVSTHAPTTEPHLHTDSHPQPNRPQ